jgi:signal peptidase I
MIKLKKIAPNRKILYLLILGFIAPVLAIFFWPQKISLIPSGILGTGANPSPASVLPEKGEAAGSDCVTKIEERTVNGSSLAGLIESGSVVKILFGYYNCHEVKKNDVIIYSYAGDKNSLIKVAKGIPGDQFHLEKSATGCWNILINNEAVINSKNISYCFDDRGYRRLILYEKSYQGVIPANAYFILGNAIEGTLDSTHFGLVGRQDILGKAIWPANPYSD